MGVDIMRMKATDAFHTSATRTVQAGQEFETTDPVGRELERRGLATMVDAGGDGTKTDQAPLNKAEPLPLNKSEPADDVGPADISRVRKRRTGQTAPAPAGVREGYPETPENPG